MAEMMDRALDWETTEAEDTGGGFRILENGYYPFTVTGFERERFQGSAKMPSCPMAKLTLEAQDNGSTSNVFVRLYLTERQIWKVAQFFTCIGAQKNEAGKVIIDWSIVEGAQGWMKVKKRTYAVQQGEHRGEERESNDVEFFCKPEEFEKAWREYSRQCGEDPDALMAAQGAQAAAAASQAQPAAPVAGYPQGVPQAAPQAAQQAFAPAPQPQQQPAPWSMS